MKKLLWLCTLFCLSVIAGAEQFVRVQLADNLTAAQVKTSGKVYIYAPNQTKKYKVSSPATLKIKQTGNTLHIGAFKNEGPLIIEPTEGVLLTFQNNTYTGKLYAIPDGKTFQLIEYTDLEDYLLGVLPYEMSHSWPLEALKAQAVAARTYTVMQIKQNKKKQFDLYNDVRSQMYKGSGQVYDSVRQAVEGTAGQVLSYKGELFNTYYHANCGGGTDDAKIWTGSSASTVKPLQGTSCSTDTQSKSYSWKANIPAASVNKFVNNKGLKGSVTKIKVHQRSSSKRAITLQFTTSNGTKNLSCAQFRLAVGAGLLKSCKITAVSKTGPNFAFSGHGFGHGIGMCQDGAKGMAQQGKTYKQILNHYFPSSDLTEL